MTGQRPVTRRRVRGWKTGLLVALVLVAVAAPWPLRHAGTALVVSRDLDSPDAIVMLASHEWERLPAAAALARRHPGAVVLLTVPVAVTQYNCHLCRIDPRGSRRWESTRRESGWCPSGRETRGKRRSPSAPTPPPST